MLLDTVVDIGHEVVEVRTPLASDRHQLKEQVHQHGFAASDATMDIKAAHRFVRWFSLAEEPAERARLGGEALG